MMHTSFGGQRNKGYRFSAKNTGKLVTACVLLITVLMPVFAQAVEYYQCGYYIGLDDIDNDMWLYPGDDDGMYEVEFYFGDNGRNLKGTAEQEGDMLVFEVKDAYVPQKTLYYYHGTVEMTDDNEYTVYLTGSYKDNPEEWEWEVYRFCWISE